MSTVNRTNKIIKEINNKLEKHTSYITDSTYNNNYLLSNHNNILILINDVQNDKIIGLTLDNLSNYIKHNFTTNNVFNNNTNSNNLNNNSEIIPNENTTLNNNEDNTEIKIVIQKNNVNYNLELKQLFNYFYNYNTNNINISNTLIDNIDNKLEPKILINYNNINYNLSLDYLLNIYFNYTTNLNLELNTIINNEYNLLLNYNNINYNLTLNNLYLYLFKKYTSIDVDTNIDYNNYNFSINNGDTINSMTFINFVKYISTKFVSTSNNFEINYNNSNNKINFKLSSNLSVTSISVGSDIRHKDNVNDFTNCLDKIDKIKPKTFNYKNKKKKHIGFIAQELLESDIDYIVNKDDPDYYKVDYNSIIGLLTGCVKELKDELSELKKENINLRNELKNKNII